MYTASTVFARGSRRRGAREEATTTPLSTTTSQHFLPPCSTVEASKKVGTNAMLPFYCLTLMRAKQCRGNPPEVVCTILRQTPKTTTTATKTTTNASPQRNHCAFLLRHGNRGVSSTHPSEFQIETTAPSVGLGMRSELWLTRSGACPNKLARLRLILFVCMNNIWNQTVKMCCSRCSSWPTASFLSLLPAVVVRLSPCLFLSLSFALSLSLSEKAELCRACHRERRGFTSLATVQQPSGHVTALPTIRWAPAIQLLASK